MNALSHEETVLRSIEEFRRARAEVSAEGVSWICGVQQLELLIRRYPERARAVLSDVDRERAAASPSSPRTGPSGVSWATASGAPRRRM